MARTSEEARLGELGVTEVCRNIERLGWGTTVNSRHDFGTDVFMLVLGAGGEDLRLIVGAQVKTGDSYFREPRFSSDGELEGWWYRDRRRAHVDTWATHAVPHLIVLHDLALEASYWVHVTTDSIVSTGVGAKIFVPGANLIDEDHRADLEAAAASRSGGFEGSAWKGLPPPSPEDSLRYSLIVPRLIAPHPNAGVGRRPAAEEALALVVLDRLRQYERFAEEHRMVPTLERARTSARWSWRLVGALAHWLFHQEFDELVAVFHDAPDASSRAAAAVLASGASIDSGDPDEALRLLRRAISAGGYSPVDEAWLGLQSARCCVEIGHLEEARDAAFAAYAIRPYSASDVTAAALLGAAAALIFNTADWGAKELDELISAGDTAAAWWRSQTTRYGLGALAERNFKAWTRDDSVTIAAEDLVEHHLESSALMAGNAVDQDGWRHLVSLRARSELMCLDRSADPAEAHVGLRRLVASGDSASLKLAIDRLLADGPARALSLVGEDLRLGGASRTSALAELTFLNRAGSMVDTGTADRVVRWLLATLSDPDAYERRVTPTFALTWGLLEALGGVVGAAGLRVQRQVIRHIAALPPQRGGAVAREWARVLEALPRTAWTEDLAFRVKPHTGRHDRSLEVQLLGIAARHDRGARRSLLNRVRRGELDSLAALGNVTGLPDQIAGELIGRLAERVRQVVSRARRGRQEGWGGQDPGEALVLMNVWFPELARWDPMYELLEEPRVVAHQKQRPLVFLANLVDRIPPSVRERLSPIALKLAGREGTPAEDFFGVGPDVVGRAWNLAVVLGDVDLDRDARPLVELLNGSPEERRWVSFIAARLRRPADAGILSALCCDPYPIVRASAAGGLAAMLHAGVGGDLVVAGLRRAAEDPGTSVPREIAEAFAGFERPGPFVREVLGDLRRHPSAAVRSAAKGEG